MERRIASVQHGDYVEALRIIGRGDPEPYFGMAYSLDVLASLFDQDPHLVISLNAPKYREHHGQGEFVGLPCPSLPSYLPRSLAAEWWGRKIVQELQQFSPTHVLLRSGGVVARHVLRFCIAHGINTLVIFANRFDASNSLDRFMTQRLVRMLNHPCVKIVGNHKQPATDTMLEFGVEPSKVVAWDWPNAKHPSDWPAKLLNLSLRPKIVYVGTVSLAKGVGDLIDAVEIVLSKGREVDVAILGDGADFGELKARAAENCSGAVEFLGRVSNEIAFQKMLDATVVCVPSRHEFSEGMPLTLTEALASRTPVLISDHPVFIRAFSDGVGVRIFKASSATSLANALINIIFDQSAYKILSETTIDAFRGVECKTYFGDLVNQWKRAF